MLCQVLSLSKFREVLYYGMSNRDSGRGQFLMKYVCFVVYACRHHRAQCTFLGGDPSGRPLLFFPLLPTLKN